MKISFYVAPRGGGVGSEKGLVLAQTLQDHVLSTKEMALPHTDKGQGIKDKARR